MIINFFKRLLCNHNWKYHHKTLIKVHSRYRIYESVHVCRNCSVVKTINEVEHYYDSLDVVDQEENK